MIFRYITFRMDELDKTKDPRRKKLKLEKNFVSYEELQAKIQVLEEHTKKQKKLTKSPKISSSTGIQKTEKRSISIKNPSHVWRHVLLRLTYLHWDYQNLSSQDLHSITEQMLLEALVNTSLIDSPDTCDFQSFGHPEDGMNAFNHIIGVRLRNYLSSGLQVLPVTAETIIKEEPLVKENKNINIEINYPESINAVLPPQLRVVAWCPVEAGYTWASVNPHQTYKYFFPRGNIDIEIMDECAQLLTGHHDYRNLLYKKCSKASHSAECRNVLSVSVSPMCCDMQECKIDEEATNSGTEGEEIAESAPEEDQVSRDITKTSIARKEKTVLRRQRVCKLSHNNAIYDMCVATIQGKGFRKEEIQRIISALLLVGEGEEDPSFFLELLRETSPRGNEPLQVYQSSLEGENWLWDQKALQSVISKLHLLWTQHSARASALRHSLWDFESHLQEVASSEVVDAVASPLSVSSHQCVELVKEEVEEKSFSEVLPSTSGKQDSTNFSHEARRILINVMKQKYKRFLTMHSREKACKEVQQELAIRGFSFSLEEIREKCTSFVSSFHNLRSQTPLELSEVPWEYFKVMDDMLGAHGSSYHTKSPERAQPSPPVLVNCVVKPSTTPEIKKEPPVVHFIEESQPTAHPSSSHVLLVPTGSYPSLDSNQATSFRTTSVQPPATATPFKTAPRSSPLTKLHHVGDNVFASHSVPAGQQADHKQGHMVDMDMIFLQYHLQQGQQRLDKLEDQVLAVMEENAQKRKYRDKQEIRDKLYVKCLNNIAHCTSSLKDELLNV